MTPSNSSLLSFVGSCNKAIIQWKPKKNKFKDIYWDEILNIQVAETTVSMRFYLTYLLISTICKTLWTLWPPARSLREGKVFARVCLSICERVGSFMWPGPSPPCGTSLLQTHKPLPLPYHMGAHICSNSGIPTCLDSFTISTNFRTQFYFPHRPQI